MATVKKSRNTAGNPRNAAASKTRASKPGPISLASFVPSKVNVLATQLTAAFSREIEPHGIAVAEWRVLIALQEASPSRLSDLSQATQIDLSTLSRLVRRLESRALCTIEVAGRDRRIGTISLASAGRKLLATLLPIGRAFEDGMLAGLTPSERRACAALLDRLRSNLALFLADKNCRDK